MSLIQAALRPAIGRNCRRRTLPVIDPVTVVAAGAGGPIDRNVGAHGGRGTSTMGELCRPLLDISIAPFGRNTTDTSKKYSEHTYRHPYPLGFPLLVTQTHTHTHLTKEEEGTLPPVAHPPPPPPPKPPPIPPLPPSLPREGDRGGVDSLRRRPGDRRSGDSSAWVSSPAA